MRALYSSGFIDKIYCKLGTNPAHPPHQPGPVSLQGAVKVRTAAGTERRVRGPDLPARGPVPASRDSSDSPAEAGTAGTAAAENGSLCVFLCIDRS